MIEKVREKLITDNETLKEIADYLINHCENEPVFIDKVLNEKKSLTDCFEYIKSEAKKEAVNGSACISKEIVFGWAVHYFDEEHLEWRNTEVKEESRSKKKIIKKKPFASGQLSLFDI